MCITRNLTTGLNSTHMPWCQEEICKNDWVAHLNLIVIFCPTVTLPLSAGESHPEMKAPSYPTWAAKDLFLFGLRAYFVVSLLPRSLVSSSIHPSVWAPVRRGRGREKQTTCFREDSSAGRIQDQSTPSSPAPLASLSCTLSLGTRMADLCWNGGLY